MEHINELYNNVYETSFSSILMLNMKLFRDFFIMFAI